MIHGMMMFSYFWGALYISKHILEVNYEDPNIDDEDKPATIVDLKKAASLCVNRLWYLSCP